MRATHPSILAFLSCLLFVLIPGPDGRLSAQGTTGAPSFVLPDNAGDWQQFGFGPSHTGYNPAENIVGPTTVRWLDLAWRRSSPCTITGQPLVVGGVVYAVDGCGYVTAWDAMDGTEVWRISLAGVNTTLAYASGMIIAGEDSPGRIVALNAETGEQVWSDSTEGSIRAAAPVISDGTVFAVTNTGHLYAFNLANGEEKWSQTLGVPVYSTPAVHDGAVFFGARDSSVYAVNAVTGTVLWSVRTGGWVDATIVADTSLNLILASSDDGSLYALDAGGGSVLWNTRIDDPPLTGRSPAVADGIVYIGAVRRGLVIGIDAVTGEEVWRAPSGGSVTSSPTIANGVQFIGSANGTWRALDHVSGEIVWKSPVVFRTPPAVRGGYVFGSSYSQLCAFQAPAPLLVLGPNGGESLFRGSTDTIRWSSIGPSGVTIEYSTDAGGNWTVVAASVPAASGRYPWVVPDALSSETLIRISDAADPAVYDISDSLFTIQDAPLITVFPDFFDVIAGEGEIVSRTLTIGNTGAGDLRWTIRSGGPGAEALLPGTMALPVARTDKQIAEISSVAATTFNEGDTGPPTISRYSADALTGLAGTKKVLAWIGYTDRSAGGEYENTLNAIYEHFTDFALDTTTTTLPDRLSQLLEDKDIFLVPEQENYYDLGWLGRDFAQVLASFVRRGGAMIVLDASMTGSTTMLNGTGLLNITSPTCCLNTAVVFDQSSPLVLGIPDTFAVMNATYSHSSSQGRPIVKDLNRYARIVTVRDTGAGQIVYIGMDFYSYNSEMARLLANAVEWSGWGFLSVNQAGGIIQPGSTEDLEVSVGSKTLWSGDYEGSLVISSNDPLRARVVVPVDYHVSGRPIIGGIADSIDFGTTFIGQAVSNTITLENNGSETLIVSGVSSDNGAFSIAPSSVSIAPHGTQDMVATFFPYDAGSYDGTLSIASNDPMRPILTIPVSGRGLHPPNITVAPDSIIEVIDEGDSTTRTMTIGNTGLGLLTWSATPVNINNSSVIAASPVFQSDTTVIKEGICTSPPERPASTSVYTATVLPFQKSDMSEMARDTKIDNTIHSNGLGNVLEHLNADSLSMIQAIPNRYDFSDGRSGSGIGDGGNDMYDGGNYLSTNLCAGIAYSDNVIVDNTCFGEAGAYFTRKYPGLFIFAADLDGVNYFEISGDLGADGGGMAGGSVLHSTIYGVNYIGFVKRVWNAYDPSVNHLIIVEEDPSVNHEFSTYTNDDYHRVSGLTSTRRLYYLLYAGSYGSFIDDDATLGIMNAFLSVARVSPEWISFNPSAGSVAPGTTEEVVVTLNAAQTEGGTYHANIVIANNDHANNPVLVPARLGVIGKPLIGDFPGGIEFGLVHVGGERTDTIIVNNLGSEILVVTDISTDTEVFTSTPSELSIPPHGSGEIHITFAPVDTGAYAGALTVTCNDPTKPVRSSTLTGRAFYPPSVFVSPSSFDVTVTEGDSTVRMLTIGNTGLGDLHWQIRPGRSGDEGSMAARQIDLLERTNEEIDSVKSPARAPAGTTAVGSSTISPYTTSEMLRLAGSKRILAWTGNADLDPGGSFENTLNAVYQHYADFTVVVTTTTEPGELEELLSTADIFLMPYQWGGDLGALGSALAPVIGSFVIRGGALIVLDSYNCEWWWCGEGAATDFLNGTGLMDVSFVGTTWMLSGVTVVDTSDWVVRGVPSVFDLSGSGNTHVSSDGRAVVMDTWGNNVVTMRDTGAGHVIYLGMDFYSYNSDMARLLANAVQYSGWRFLSMDPESGVLTPGSTQKISVRINADDLWSGDYEGSLVVTSDDPVRNPALVRVGLHVTGTPLIGVVPDSLEFGSKYAGTVGVETLTVNNLGSDMLYVSDISSDTSVFSASPRDFTVPPHGSQEVLVTFSPTGSGSFPGVLSLSSNTVSRPVVHVPVSGIGLDPPAMVLSPDSFSVTLAEGDTTVRTLTIGNSGPGELYWKITTGRRGEEGSAAQAAFTPRARSEKENVEAALSAAARPGGKEGGPPTISRYSSGELMQLEGSKRILAWIRYADLNPGGEFENTLNAIYEHFPDYSLDTTSTMSAATLETLLGNKDIFLVPTQEGISDLWGLGNNFKTVLTPFITSGGTMIVLDGSPTGSTSMLNGTGILDIYYVSCCYTSAVVHDMDSPLITGLPYVFDVTYASNRHNSTNGRAIVTEQYSGANMVTVKDTGSGQVIYLGMSFYSYNSEMARLLANAVETSGWRFLSITPGTGVVPPGGSGEVSVRFRGEGLWSGDYEGSLVITGNDPGRPRAVVPVNMHINGRPIIGITPDTIDFGTHFVGLPGHDTVIVENIGSEILVVSDISVDTAAFIAVPSSVSIPPHGRQEVLVTYDPSDTGFYAGSLTLTSGDTGRPVVQIPLSGRSYHAPVMTVSPGEIRDSLREGETRNLVVTIANTGKGVLSYRIDREPYNQNYALYLDGDGDWMQVGSTGLPTGNGERTIEMWAMKSSYYAGPLVWQGGDGVPGGVLLLEMNDRFTVNSGGATVYGSRYIDPDTWYHVAVVTRDNQVIVYVNGEYDAGGHLQINTPEGATMMIGRRGQEVSYFRGTLDDVRIWNYARSQKELRANMSAELRGSEPGLVVYHPLNEGTGGFAGNMTGIGPDAVINGSALWKLSTVPLAPSWLDAGGDSGTCAPDSARFIPVGLDAGALGAGLYSSGLTIRSNDPLRSAKFIPVHLNVTGPPRFAVTPEYLEFDSGFVGIASTTTLTVRNRGKDTISVSTNTADTAIFDISDEQFILPPFGSRHLTVTFTAPDTGIFTDSVIIRISGSDTSDVRTSVPLTGRGLNRPEMAVAPDTISLMMHTNRSTSKSLTIFNSGRAELTVLAGKGTGGSWLIASPDTLVIPPGDSTSWEVSISTVGLAEGTYWGSLLVSGNDPITPWIRVPVHLICTGRFALAVSRDTVTFGNVPVGYPDTTFLMLRNDFNASLRVTSLAVDDPHFHLLGDTAMQLAPGKQKVLPVAFAPAEAASYSGILTIRTDHPIDSVFLVVLGGTGVHRGIFTLATDSLDVAFDHRLSGKRTIRIHNTGGGPLSIRIVPEGITESARAHTFSIGVDDALRGTVTRTFGVHPEATRCIDEGLGEFPMPPPPPDGGFDVRWTDPRNGTGCFEYGLTIDLRPYAHPAQTDTFNLVLQTKPANYPFMISWSADIGKSVREARMVDRFGGIIVNTRLDNAGSMVLADPLVRELMIITDDIVTADSCVVAVPDEGLVPPGDSLEVSLEYRGCSGDSAEYTTYLTILTDDPVNRAVFIPVHVTILSGVDSVAGSIPGVFSLEQNYPNPFNPRTTIKYGLPEAVHVRLSVFNILGQEVEVLVDEAQGPGYRSVTFDAGRFPSGMYTYRITAGNFTEVRKMILVK